MLGDQPAMLVIADVRLEQDVVAQPAQSNSNIHRRTAGMRHAIDNVDQSFTGNLNSNHDSDPT
ncbi:hypothetical protein GCM10017709_18570 [Glutamicibacter nicotianae]|uniref:Uncharacterized protein n=1 Tax=Glutamicibacter nicotianae TaxID=37929 RepID=A0ABQ0RKF8_GLUNI|nr:hypothetical protein ANI01nite_15050 [Glutamicibacter nicotianae]